MPKRNSKSENTPALRAALCRLLMRLCKDAHLLPRYDVDRNRLMLDLLPGYRYRNGRTKQ